MANKLEGISVALPLVYDGQDGPYRLNKTINDVVKQNFKNLILTSPGERIMLPDFGAGIRQMLFESYTAETFRKVQGRIMEQVSRYMPFLEIENISFQTSETNISLSPNSVRVIIQYNLGAINESDTLIITETND